jgi:hypothetical protein
MCCKYFWGRVVVLRRCQYLVGRYYAVQAQGLMLVILKSFLLSCLRKHWNLFRDRSGVYDLLVIHSFCELIHKDLGTAPNHHQIMGVITVSTDSPILCIWTKVLHMFKEEILWLSNISFGWKETGKFRTYSSHLLITNISTKELLVIVLAGVLLCRW